MRDDGQTSPAPQERPYDRPDLPWEMLVNTTNQLIVYVVEERLTEMVENEGILAQAQGGFRQNKT